nr:MAG TPA: hypothetical protein [Caudoviricetes sp.]DAN00971.1 MAG TPA: hypothetical protein [Caudoviricetes sp.]
MECPIWLRKPSARNVRESTMIYLRVPDVESIGAAVAESVANYFKR